MYSLQALGMLFWHEYDIKKALDDMPNFKAFQGTTYFGGSNYVCYIADYILVYCCKLSFCFLSFFRGMDNGRKGCV